MRLKVGLWIAGTGLIVAGLGAVPASLGVPLVAWLCFVGGVVLAVGGAIHAMRGETPDERRKREHEHVIARNALENERDDLTARRSKIDADLDIRGYWHNVATSYSDNLRATAIDAEVATLAAERDGIDRRLAQIEHELSTL